MKTHTFKNCAAQGDLLITRVQEIPEDAVLQTPEDEGVYIVAHSETGHHHVIESDPVEYFWAKSSNDEDFEGQVAYLRVNEPVTLRHLRSFDTHAPIQISPGIFRLNQQREYTPEGLRRAVD
jgi:hypothetical protein